MVIKDKNSTNIKKTSLTLATVVALVAVFGAIYLIVTQNSPKESISDVTDQMIESTDSAPAMLSEDNAKSKKEHIENYKDPNDYPRDQSHDSRAKVDFVPVQEGTVVVIRTQLTSIEDGACRLTVTNGEKTHSETVDVLYQPIYSTCKGFSVPVSHLGPGIWTINLQATPIGGQSAKSSGILKVST